MRGGVGEAFGLSCRVAASVRTFMVLCVTGFGQCANSIALASIQRREHPEPVAPQVDEDVGTWIRYRDDARLTPRIPRWRFDHWRKGAQLGRRARLRKAKFGQGWECEWGGCQSVLRDVSAACAPTKTNHRVVLHDGAWECLSRRALADVLRC